MPWRITPPSSAAASNSVTGGPGGAAGRPPTGRPARRPPRPRAACALPQGAPAAPSPCQRRSPTKRSSRQIDSASSWPPRLQAASQGWWQMRPAIAGKGLWRTSVSQAPCRSPRAPGRSTARCRRPPGRPGGRATAPRCGAAVAARQVPVWMASVVPVVQVGARGQGAFMARLLPQRGRSQPARSHGGDVLVVQVWAPAPPRCASAPADPARPAPAPGAPSSAELTMRPSPCARARCPGRRRQHARPGSTAAKCAGRAPS
jgi:hypothetical protein